MGTVKINDLRVNAVIGTLDHERIHRQELIFDVEFDYDSTRAAGTDDFMTSVDYSAVERCIVESVSASSFKLLEALALFIGNKILDEFAVSRIKITISKPAASAYGALISYTGEFFPGRRA